MRYVAAVIAPALAAALAYALNLPQSLGAHPWWSQNVILIGLPIGLVIAWGLALTPLSRIAAVSLTGGAAVVTAVAAVTAKARFAASYAEDVLAGQMWYFGWIGTCGLVAALLATLLWPQQQTH